MKKILLISLLVLLTTKFSFSQDGTFVPLDTEVNDQQTFAVKIMPFSLIDIFKGSHIQLDIEFAINENRSFQIGAGYFFKQDIWQKKEINYGFQIRPEYRFYFNKDEPFKNYYFASQLLYQFQKPTYTIYPNNEHILGKHFIVGFQDVIHFVLLDSYLGLGIRSEIKLYA